MRTAKQYLKELWKKEEVIFVKDSRLIIIEDENKRTFSQWAKDTLQERFQLNLAAGRHSEGQLIVPARLESYIHIVKFKKKEIMEIISKTPLEKLLRGEFND